MNETIISAKAAELDDEAKEQLKSEIKKEVKREVLEEVAKNFTKKTIDIFGSDLKLENATDFAKQLTELRTNVLTNTQREYKTQSLR